MNKDVMMEEESKTPVSVQCTPCGYEYTLESEMVSALEQGKSVQCPECATALLIKEDPHANLKGMLTMLFFLVGFGSVAILALLNMFMDTGISTWAVSLPVILVSAIMVAAFSNKPLELVPAEVES